MRDPNRRFDVPPKDVSSIVNREAQAINKPESVRSDRTPTVDGRILPGRRINVFASLKSHQLLALSVAAVTVLIGLLLAWALGRITFYTEAVISVSPPHGSREDGRDLVSNSQFGEYLEQQLRTVNRYDIVLATLRSQPGLSLRCRRPSESEQHAAERLQTSLVIRPVPRTNLFTVGLEGEGSARLADLVNALVNTYIKRERSDDLKRRDQY